ncbi:hypothetical protein ACTJKC_15145 [Pedobacter sp. 22226]|uniref:hypothetical protein n=1 Tax=Pedobacter sp. 22226 TaxID=3453894 RepID=UPI003F8344C1
MKDNYNSDLYKSVYNSDADEVLLKKIIELQNTIDTAKMSPNKSSKAIEFYESVIATMKYAWAQLVELEGVHLKNKFLNTENGYLKCMVSDLQQELNKYRTVEKLVVTGELDEIVKAVDNYLKNRKPNEQ